MGKRDNMNEFVEIMIHVSSWLHLFELPSLILIQ